MLRDKLRVFVSRISPPLRSIASQDLAIQLSSHVFRRFIVLVFTTIYNHLKARLEIYGKSIGVLMGTGQCGEAILDVNLAAGRQWETCEVSGKTLLLSAAL